jgi:hypothetical protein
VSKIIFESLKLKKAEETKKQYKIKEQGLLEILKNEKKIITGRIQKIYEEKIYLNEKVIP